MWRHFKEEHNEEEQPYELKVVSLTPGDPLLCQLTEAILIEEKKPLLIAEYKWGDKNILRKQEPGDVVPRHKIPTSRAAGDERGHQVALINLAII